MDRHVLGIGKFWLNLASLELLLRLFLVKKSREREIGLELNKGDRCELTHLTNYDSFGVLARKYNELASPQQRITAEPIEHFRDALAHGRSLTMDPSAPMTIVKFSKADKATGTVTVEFRETMTDDVIRGAVTSVFAAISAVSEQLASEFPGTASFVNSREDR